MGGRIVSDTLLKDFDMRLRTSDAVFDRCGFTADERAPIAGDAQRLRADIREPFTRAEEALQGNTLTPLSERVLRDVAAHGSRVVAPHVKRVDALRDQIVQMENAAAAGYVPAPSGVGYVDPAATPAPTTIAGLHAAQERRDRIAKIEARVREQPQTERELYYMMAVDTGSDPDFVRVIESAPRAFPLVRPEILKQARQIRIKKSPMRPALEKLRVEHQVREGFVRDVQSVIERMARA
jgi:hypothetical protein